MTTETVNKIKTLHQDTLDFEYDKPTWKSMLSTMMSGSELQEIHDAVMNGSIKLRDESIVDIARTEYPWMFTEMEYLSEMKDGTSYMAKAPRWIDKIRNRGITRPKDILHLDKILRLAENAEALSEMRW